MTGKAQDLEAAEAGGPAVGARVLAIDVWDHLTRIAWGNSPGELAFALYEGEPVREQVQRCMTAHESLLISATEESWDQFPAIKQAGIKVKVLPRLLAGYWAFAEQIGPAPCIVLAIGKESASAGLVVAGQLQAQRQVSDVLSLKGMWNKFVDGHEAIKKLINAHKRKDEQFDETLFQAFTEALKTGQAVSIGNLPLRPSQILNSSVTKLNALLDALDPAASSRQVVVCDWAAISGDLLDPLGRRGGEVLRTAASSAFVQVACGLIAFGLHHSQGQAEAPKPTKAAASDPDEQVRRSLEQRYKMISGGSHLARVAELVGSTYESLEGELPETGNLQKALTPYLRVAAKSEWLRQSIAQLHGLPQAVQKERCGEIDQHLRAMERDLRNLEKYHRVPWLVDLLGAARRSTRQQAHAAKLEELLEIEEIEVIVDKDIQGAWRHDLNVVSTDGSGSRVVICELVESGYKQKRTGAVIKKPKVRVRFED